LSSWKAFILFISNDSNVTTGQNPAPPCGMIFEYNEAGAYKERRPYAFSPNKATITHSLPVP
jgi:hypothetical protein